jgi:hypothetical protein
MNSPARHVGIILTFDRGPSASWLVEELAHLLLSALI